MVGSTRVFIEGENYDIVMGDSILKFSQGDTYYDAQRQPVKKKPKMPKPVVVAEEPKQPEKEEVNPLTVGDFNSAIPQSVLSAEKENALAAHAEEQAG